MVEQYSHTCIHSLLESDFELWDERDEVIEDMESAPSQTLQDHSIGEEHKMKILVQWIIMYISCLRILFSISDSASNFILQFLSILLGFLGHIFFFFI